MNREGMLDLLERWLNETPTPAEIEAERKSLAEIMVALARPEGSVVLPAELAAKILEQHELAAEALVDSHGDIHREIVQELRSRVPQEQNIKE